MAEPDIDPQPPQPVPASVGADEKKKKSRASSPWVLVPVACLFVLLLLWGLEHLAHALTHETTDDAFIEGRIVAIAPKVPAQVANVFVHDNQMVKKDDLLVALDPSDYEARVAQKQASIRTSEANLKAVSSLLELMNARMATAEASAKQAHAQADASSAIADRARADFKRAKQLFSDGTISQQDFDGAQAAAKAAEATLKADEQNAAAEDSKVTEAKSQWSAAHAAVDLAKAQISQAQTDIDSAQLDLSYTKIFAPCNGRVTRKSVEPGAYVQVGQSLFALVETNVWVVANFKETQLTDMRPGQAAQIHIDAYPEKEFRGHVDSIMSGSGSRFSLLPPENAVGNFVKVVQRVPVKILFEDAPVPGMALGPGMSVVPSVSTSSVVVSPILLWVGAVVLAVLLTLGVKRVINHLQD